MVFLAILAPLNSKLKHFKNYISFLPVEFWELSEFQNGGKQKDYEKASFGQILES